MCGILGFTGNVPEGKWGQTHRLLQALFVAAEPRGQDATGFAALAAPRKHGERQDLIVEKQPVPASRFVAENPTWQRLRHRRCLSLIGHVRFATHGDPADNRNNHPFLGEKGLALVHNGVIANHQEIADKYHLRLVSECDSEVLLRLIEAHRYPMDGIAACLRECRGSTAVALMDTSEGSLWLAHNTGRPLWVAKLRNDRRWWFASTGAILLDAFAAVLGKGNVRVELMVPLAEGIVHLLHPSGSFWGFDETVV
jgi:glucosamine 6-phosphate synthetase-like amidotransferase/phosphosugar isomerase protein